MKKNLQEQIQRIQNLNEQIGSPEIDDNNFVERLDDIDKNINTLIDDLNNQGLSIPEPLSVFKSAADMAISDMKKEDEDYGDKTNSRGRGSEIWNHSPVNLKSKETTKLNHDLGIGNYGKDSRSKNYKG